MRLAKSTEELTREVSTPDQAHKGVKFSSLSHGSSEVTLSFTRWVDMHYPNKIVVEITPQYLVPPAAPAAEAQSA